MLTPVPPRRPRHPFRSAVLLGSLLGLGSGAMCGLWASSMDPATLPAPVAMVQWASQAWESRDESATTQKDLTLLVMGTDNTASRRSLRGNTDTMLLVHLNPESHRVSVLSIPRDTRMAIPGHRTFKVNAANPWGGPDLAVETVSRFLKVPIDRYLLVDLSGISEVIDALGGLDVEIPKRMAYVDRAGGLNIDLAEGRQRLDGAQVESFLRFRHDGMGDIGRVSRQQDLLREAMPQVLHPVNWVKFPKLWAIVRAHSETNLSTGDVLSLAGWLNQLDPATDVEVETLPGRSATVDGLSYWVADRGEARQTARRMTEPPQISVVRRRS
ncbi:putative transcriptional regulator YvhJ [compost metagenome]